METPTRLVEINLSGKATYTEEEKRQLLANLDLEGKFDVV